jgi:hypothetical protein
MDDLNRRMQDARRKAAREDQDRPAPAPEDRPGDKAGEGELRLDLKQGEWRYYLADQRLKPGTEIEFWVDPRLGWVRGVFHWGRRRDSVPTIRIPITRPETDEALGEAEITLPDGAICRWPT